MAATTSFKEVNGAGATATTVTNIRFCTTDSYNPTTTYPAIVPSSGSNYSYWKHIYLNADTAPAGTINNLKFFTDGTIGWTGVTMKVAEVASYEQASGTQGTTGDNAATDHVNTPTMVDASTYTSASPLSLTGTITGTTGKINTGYLLLQTTISTSAGPGTLAAETLTIRYDET